LETLCQAGKLGVELNGYCLIFDRVTVQLANPDTGVLLRNLGSLCEKGSFLVNRVIGPGISIANGLIFVSNPPESRHDAQVFLCLGFWFLIFLFSVLQPFPYGVLKRTPLEMEM
jgi:hypothetical protein